MRATDYAKSGPDHYGEHRLVHPANRPQQHGQRGGVQPDGRTLATDSADQTVRLWGMNLDQTIQMICATIANTLTPAKWKQYVSTDLPYGPRAFRKVVR